MAILDDLQALYDNGWDASFDYKGQVCGIFPNSAYDIVVVLGDNEFKVSSFDELISLQINGKTLLEIMSEVEVQYGWSTIEKKIDNKFRCTDWKLRKKCYNEDMKDRGWESVTNAPLIVGQEMQEPRQSCLSLQVNQPLAMNLGAFCFALKCWSLGLFRDLLVRLLVYLSLSIPRMMRCWWYKSGVI